MGGSLTLQVELNRNSLSVFVQGAVKLKINPNEKRLILWESSLVLGNHFWLIRILVDFYRIRLPL